jgi:UPF0176 protein
MTEETPFRIATFYRFVSIEDPGVLRQRVLELGRQVGLCGTILIAGEGINATIAARADGVDAFMEQLCEDPRFQGIEARWSLSNEQPFARFKVKVKREIVTMGVEGINPHRNVGEYIEPEAWNDLISRPDVLLVDTRNDYEVGIGTFKGAIDPETPTFRDFPAYVESALASERDRPVAMFCTGGIRCEKATAYLRERGFSEVYHLKGGILAYLESVPPDESFWEGDCFVFDERIAVGDGLKSEEYILCRTCQKPIRPGTSTVCGKCDSTPVAIVS